MIGNSAKIIEKLNGNSANERRVACRLCVLCARQADSFCARCGVTPYCSQRCQQRDWAGRHRAVCHNLARLAGEGEQKDSAEEPVIPQPAPLRRPRSPAAKESFNYKRDTENNSPRHDDGPTKKYIPAGLNQRPDNANFRGKDNSGSRYNNDNSGSRFNNDNSGSRYNNDKSGSRYNNDNSGARSNDRPYRKNNDNDNSRNDDGFRNNNRGRPNQGQDKAMETPTKPAEPTPEVKPVPKPESPKVTAKVEPPKQVAAKVEPPKQVAAKVEPPKQVAAKVPVKELPKSPAVAPASVADVTPTKKLVPKTYLIETLSIGDTILLQVDAKAEDCRARGGFVCLSMHKSLEADFQLLCDQYAADCEGDTSEYKPTPGESFSYFNPEDGGWYRARSVTASLAALLDASKIVPTSSKCARLPERYQLIAEFCCLLDADNVQIGDNLWCTLKSKTPNGYEVALERVDTAAKVGSGSVMRWIPEVEYPKPPAPSVAQQAQVSIPEVPRPDVNTKTAVLLVDMTSLERGFVRPADDASQIKFDTVLQDAALAGMQSKPLTEPPQKGQIVIAKFTDGLHYRALLKRTNVKQNKYLLEYVEFGNTQVTTLENLYPCPPELQLSAHPAVTSQVSLASNNDDVELTPPAVEYVDKLKDDNIELLLTLPSGVLTAPSGSAVTLTVVKSNESVNRKLEVMCTAEWKQIEQRAGDVLETERLMFSDLEQLELPAEGCELDILDFSPIGNGTLHGCQRGLPHADYVFTQLTEKIGRYCSSEIGREPYLPKAEELCIAQLPPYPQWFRAVFLEQVSGAGGAEAQVCYVDYGNLERVSVKLLRKMLPEFVRGLPAVASMIVIRDFPKNASPEVQAKALEFMQMNDEGRGVLRVTKCVKETTVDAGMYIVDAPDLIAAIKK